MKYLIKSTFMLILLMTVFNVGLSNAYAEEVKATETHNIERVNGISFQCQMQAIAKLAVILDDSSQVSFNLITILMEPTCEPRAFQSGRYIFVVFSDCSTYRIILTG